MPSFGANNRELVGESVVLAPSSVRTAAGSGPSVDTGERSTLRLTLNVTAASGTSPSLTATIEHSADGSTWRPHSSFAAATAVATERKTFGGIDRYVRVTWTLTGTSFTFSVSGEVV
jgi:hypothetical protein